MSDAERRSVLEKRKLRGGSWRRPPIKDLGKARYLVTAACYEHSPYIGSSSERISDFEASLIEELESHALCIYAHVILPNHYHVLLETESVVRLRQSLGKFHGRTSYQWNKEDNAKGRKIFHGSAETFMKSEGHFQATLNYIHHNPVKHGYVKKWQDWPFSSAQIYLSAVGHKEALRHWEEYPIDEYGKTWDK